MKKVLVLLLAFSLLCAFSWPPEAYDMPRTVLDADTAEQALSGLKLSAGAIGNIGLILIGITTSVSLISTIIKRLFLNQLDNIRFHCSGRRPDRFRASEPLVDNRIRESSGRSHSGQMKRSGRGDL